MKAETLSTAVIDALQNPAARRLRLLVILAELYPAPADFRAAVDRALPGLSVEQVNADLAAAAEFFTAEAERLEEIAEGGGADG